MKFATFGYSCGTLGQLQQIEDGLIEAGHSIDFNDPSIIYSNNPSYENVLAFAQKWPRAKRIFTVLDVPIHCQNYPFEIIKNQLSLAHAICSISQNARKEVKRVYGFESIVIYNPKKETFRISEIKKDIFCIYTGRANDSNKRFNLVKETLEKLGKTEKDLHIVGAENPNWGIYHGIVSDEELNELYNRSKYYICSTKVSGIELPPIECQFAHCIPVVTSDCTTAYEFFDGFLADPNADSLAAKINELEKNRVETSIEIGQAAPLRYLDLYYKVVAMKIIEIAKSLL